MDNPNSSSKLRRCNSLPSKLKIRTSLFVKSRLQKTNPYVGSFRHAPPTTLRSAASCLLDHKYYVASTGRTRRTTTTATTTTTTTFTTSIKKRSPYVGWFRHAPPVQVHSIDRDNAILLEHCCHQLAMLMTSASPCKRGVNGSGHRYDHVLITDIINGRLLGGGPEESFPGRVGKLDKEQMALPRIFNDNRDDTAASVMTRLGSWLAYQPSTATRPRSNSTSDHSSSRFSATPDFTESEREADDDDELSSDCSSLSDDSISSSVCTASDTHGAGKPSSATASKKNALPLADVAQTCYPLRNAEQHQQRLDEQEQEELDGHDRLDYVITQMDIARMARNASRHLDVDSILKLPTITYEKQAAAIVATTAREVSRATTSTPKIPIPESSPQEGWSWMMVQEEDKDMPEHNFHAKSSAKGKNVLTVGSATHRQHHHEQQAPEKGTSECCVICMEAFVQGDRLRVLPCDHSFHVGCIDRWLAGSHSFEACFTNGCPTCKKQPSLHNSVCSDGSVPSWAFARLGNVLARQAFSQFQS